MTATHPAGTLAESTIKAFTKGFAGAVVRPGDASYDAARDVWNGMIDRRPAIVARCAGVSDVIKAVRFARDNDVLVAVRSGGHSMPGLSMCDDGLVIDLSGLKGVRVDPVARIARAVAGVTLGEYDRETQVFGLATPAGAISHTGIAGLTLGGGIGWLQRKYGLTIDNLLSADVVTADGEFLVASAASNEDLYWGLRGGGGNFGIVTSFEYRVHKVGPEVLAGTLIYPIEKAAELLRYWANYVDSVPDELTTAAAVFTCPPEAPFPPHLHGKLVCGVIVCWAGSNDAGETVLKSLRAFGTPEADLVAPVQFTALQSSQDEKFAWGRRYYNKNAFVDQLTDPVIERCVAHIEAPTSPLSAVAILHMGGAVNRVGTEDTAYPNRTALYNVDITSTWTDSTEDDLHIAWVRDFHAAVKPFSTGGEYVNTTSMGGQSDVRAAYGVNFDRLVALKNRYDPTNFFRLNQNIAPTG